MLRLFVFLTLGAFLFGCSHASTTRPPATATPDTRAFLFDMKTLSRVYGVAGTGRVPLGLLNTVFIDRANARPAVLYVGQDTSRGAYLQLSMIMSAARDGLVAIDGYSYVRYEWWFVLDGDLERSSYEFTADRAPSFRVALREPEPGRWEVYDDAGTGWAIVPGAMVDIGQYEVGVRVPVQAAWGMDPEMTQTYFRAAAFSQGFIVGEDRTLGYVYPDDLSWRAVR